MKKHNNHGLRVDKSSLHNEASMHPKKNQQPRHRHHHDLKPTAHKPNHLDELSDVSLSRLAPPLPLGTPCSFEVRTADLGPGGHLLARPDQACVVAVSLGAPRGGHVRWERRDGGKGAGMVGVLRFVRVWRADVR